jgi:hypothetical protein
VTLTVPGPTAVAVWPESADDVAPPPPLEPYELLDEELVEGFDVRLHPHTSAAAMATAQIEWDFMRDLLATWTPDGGTL